MVKSMSKREVIETQNDINSVSQDNSYNRSESSIEDKTEQMTENR